MAGYKIRTFLMIEGGALAVIGLARDAQSYINNVQQTPITNNQLIEIGVGAVVLGLGMAAVEKLLRK